jgi:hypothetical protein
VGFDNVRYSFLPTSARFIKHIEMLKFTLKYLVFAPTCFGPPGPTSELDWVLCSMHAAWRSVHTPHPETHAAATLHNL